jgi:hypothetical protein
MSPARFQFWADDFCAKGVRVMNIPNHGMKKSAAGKNARQLFWCSSHTTKS